MNRTVTIGFSCALLALSCPAKASMYVGQASGNMPDADAVNEVLGLSGDDAFDKDAHTTSIDGDMNDMYGPKLGYYTVHDGDGNAYDSDDQTVQWWLEGVPVDQAMIEPFYVVIKVGGHDPFVYKFDTSFGDTVEDPGTGGAGFIDYHSMVYDLSISPEDQSDIKQGISHVAIVGRMVPEPSSLIVGMLAAVGIAVRSRRTRN